ncbi:gliding motility lipoprotein GldD [Aureisphaera galaxeae]|uniref:gliding motility lipoprotein GldD n=1 Tax=Aureisphaera galaxeae TaxID=1538023 RepID=UPI00234FED5E|nr:gliding motility lipoprotein GldD [Aureisphaera galaxeae]MDC8002715.1 gliding motility lipoprotein GldD [Aureisphaera galaxeae]
MLKLRNLLGGFLAIVLLLCFAACGDEVIVKPASKLRLDYDLAKYDSVSTKCPYSFEKNHLSRLVKKRGCGINLEYPHMRATVYLTYQPVQKDNLKKLLQDAQKLTYDHTVKANEIFEQPRVDSINKVYGMFYMINGDAATQSQFYVTDSLNHFVTGSLYFESKPNFDSIYPAVVYLRDDIRRIMETISWEE